MAVQVTTRRGWAELEAWLRSSDGGRLVDDAVLGCLPAWEADELLEEYGLPVTAATRRELGRLIDRLVTCGEA